MLSPSFPSIAENPSLSQKQLVDHSDPLASPRAPKEHPWKSAFRFPTSLSRRPTFNASPLPIETQVVPSSSTSFSQSPLPMTPSSLAPSSFVSDQRSSYNSSNTQSSDSNGGPPPRGPYLQSQNRTYPQYQQPTSIDALSASLPGKSRPHSKSEKQRANPARHPSSPHLGDPISSPPSQSSFIVVTPSPSQSRSRTNVSLSPRAMGASASRFIRRVASAPNAKALFSLGSRSAATTRNGFLAPLNTVPPLPTLESSSLEDGAESMETISSSSSRGRFTRPVAPMSAPLVRDRTNTGNLDSPGKVAFRRTYSSNSIKVRQVRRVATLLNS